MSYWKELNERNIIGRLKPLFDAGVLYVDIVDGKIRKRAQVVAYNTPWIFIKQPTWLNCELWSHVYYSQLNAIHSACFNCYKVVVRPTTVKELFEVYEVMQRLDRPSKCGIELRSYVGALYGAYFYCKGLEQGKKIHAFVRDIMTKEVRSDISVILKRGCTEFENAHGDSRNYVQKEEDRAIQDLLDKHSDIPSLVITQPDFLKDYVQSMWLAWAYRNGDKTCLEFNDGADIITQPVTYHE